MSGDLNLLLILGLILLLAGIFFYFVPGLLVKWNAFGNMWIGAEDSTKKYASLGRRLFSADYAIFANHKVVGWIMWSVSVLLLALYAYYM